MGNWGLIIMSIQTIKQRKERELTKPDIRGHFPWSNASRAALTAKSTSSLAPAATFAITSPLRGSIVSKVFPAIYSKKQRRNKRSGF